MECRWRGPEQNTASVVHDGDIAEGITDGHIVANGLDAIHILYVAL